MYTRYTDSVIYTTVWWLICALHCVNGKSSLPSKTASLGEPVRLLCGNVETVNSSIDWYYQTSMGAKVHTIISASHLTNGDRGGRLNISTSTLIIDNVQRNDSGVYTCIEDINTANGKRHQIVLTVEDKTCHSDVNAHVGEKVTLRCTSPSNNPASVTWRHQPSSASANSSVLFRSEGDKFSHLDPSARTSVNRTVKNNFCLVIHKTQHSDAGTYVCSVDVGYEKQHVTVLHVTDRPKPIYDSVKQENRELMNIRQASEPQTWALGLVIFAVVMGSIITVGVMIACITKLLQCWNQLQKDKSSDGEHSVLNPSVVKSIDDGQRKIMAKEAEADADFFPSELEIRYLSQEEKLYMVP